jgi:AraC family transcriptional regulator, exoenzyme S synthesis regulatory protein ExsA
MDSSKKLYSSGDVFFSCVTEKHFTSEALIVKNVVIRIFSGESTFIEGDKINVFGPGSTKLVARNQLVNITKYPANGEPFRSVFIYFNDDLLRKHYISNATDQHQITGSKYIVLDNHPLLDSLFGSLTPYLNMTEKLPEDIAAMKVEEAITVLRRVDQRADGILSNFREPGGIDLPDFVEKNYRFNLPLEKFAYLTGRSMTTFKKDFRKYFNTSPQKWLTSKRLELAHYYIFEKNQKPIDVYFEAGFENLSHFSYAFKRQYGYSPTSSTRLLNKVNHVS